MALLSRERPARAIGLGGLIVAFAAVVVAVLRGTLAALAGPGPLPVLPPLLIPFGTGGAVTGASAGAVIATLVYFGTALVYYAFLGVLVVGATVTGFGLYVWSTRFLRRDIRRLAWAARRARLLAVRLSGDTRVRGLLVVLALLVLLLLSPRRQFGIEILLLVLVSVLGAGLLAGVALTAYVLSPRPLVDALVVTPVALTALLLPPVVAGLLSPTLSPAIQRLSSAVAIWVLDTLLVVGGLNTLIRRAFALRGPGFVAMWLAIDLAVGWLVGLSALGLGLLPSREFEGGPESG